MTTMWIGPDDEAEVGRVGFLIEFSNNNRGSSQYVLRDHPAKTNRSYEPLLHGWCGSYNNTSTNACGLWKVVRVARNGRMQIVELDGDELVAGLEELGYPELTP